MRTPTLYNHNYELVHEGDQDDSDAETRRGPVAKQWRSAFHSWKWLFPIALFIALTVLVAGVAFWWYARY